MALKRKRPIWQNKDGTPKKRKPLPPRSEKRKKLAPVRAAFVERKLKADPYCQAGVRIGRYLAREAGHSGSLDPSASRRLAACWYLATQVHEPLTRARAPGPETILDEKNALSVCGDCHRWIHDHVAAATELELLVPSGALPKGFFEVRDADGS